MSLENGRFLFVDCQTTGIRPPAAHLLEIAWSVGAREEDSIQSHLIRLPEGQTIPRVVSEITGLGAKDLNAASAIEDVARRFAQDLESADALIIHYAQFEKPFLLDLLQRIAEHKQLPVRVLCTHQITKRLFPNLPSQNIRACAGFFGPPVVGHNRASVFVRATMQIWSGIKPELEKHALHDGESIEKWITQAPRRKSTRYEYRLDKVKRLELPDSPGVYRMLAKTGEVLYVGKATSLKSRVNSYFRGKKGRDTRKLEMLAQVWDLQVTACPTPLEAALLESDEIKRLDPPYNVVLKTGNRHLQFFARDFLSVSREQSDACPIGPFRNSNWIDHLQLLCDSLRTHEFRQIFIYQLFPEEDLREGFKIFCDRHGLEPFKLKSIRSQLALGMKLYRAFDETEDLEEEVSADEVETLEEPVVTPEDLADKFERLLRRAGAENWRAQKLTRLLNAKVTIADRTLHFRKGKLEELHAVDTNTTMPQWPWSGLAIDAYDRMSILLTELKVNHDFT